jgi:hypothetical protein
LIGRAPKAELIVTYKYTEEVNYDKQGYPAYIIKGVLTVDTDMNRKNVTAQTKSCNGLQKT